MSKQTKKIAFVVGSRPELIKMAPVLRVCGEVGLDFVFIHTGQHYSANMDEIFFEELHLPKPDYNLKVGSGTHGVQTGKMLIGLEEIMLDEKPDMVLVQGDTNSVLAGALVASKLQIPVGHVEAGLRSYDKTMPEEQNRIMTDHISDLLFVPTEHSQGYLQKEGIGEKNIHVTGNTIVDSLYFNVALAKEKSDILKKHNLTSKEYFLATIHRAENVDSKEKLTNILEAFENISTQYGIPVVLPLHPRTEKNIRNFGLQEKLDGAESGLRAIDPVGYFDFLMLESGAKLILTDSGGIQEESCILNVPAVTLRENTERPETVSVGANVLVGTDTDKILEGVDTMLKKNEKFKNPFGDGDAAEQIIKLCREF